MKTMLLRVLLLPLALWIGHSVSGQNPNQPESIFNHLTREETPKIQLRLDLAALIRLRRTNYTVPATLIGPGDRQFAVEVRSRGRYRRMKCDIPPMKILFTQETLAGAQLDTLSEIKLAFACHDEPGNRDMLVREYLAYRMFEHLSPASIRARLVQLTIQDTGKGKSREMPALLVEHERELALRLQGRLLEEYGMDTSRLQIDQVALMTVYQYMIGNTDWDLGSFRNLLLLEPGDKGKVLAVPFDFDFCGLVNAPYAVPNSESGLRNVRDRHLMSEGLSPEDLRQAAGRITGAREALLELCRQAPLSEKASVEVIRYLEKFFQAASEPKGLPTHLKN